MSTMLAYIGDELPVIVHYDFQPFEPESGTIHNGDAYPGCDASADIYQVKVGDADIVEVLSDDCISALEEACVEYENKPDDK